MARQIRRAIAFRPSGNRDARKIVPVDSNPSVAAKVLDQGPHELAGNRTKLADGVSKAEHLRVDPIGQTSPLASESSPMCGENSELLDGFGRHPTFTPKTRQAVMREFPRVEAVCLAA